MYQNKENKNSTERSSSTLHPKTGEESDKTSDLFISVKFEKLLVSTTPKSLKKPSTEKEVNALNKRDSCEVGLHTLKAKTNSRKSRRVRPVLRKSKLGESLKKMQEEKDNTTSDPKIFGRKFSSSLNDFSRLSLSSEESSSLPAETDFCGESFTNLSGCGGCKRKRASTPNREEVEGVASVSCGQQANRAPIMSDVTAEELAAYLEDTAFFPKRMSYMAEMMYT